MSRGYGQQGTSQKRKSESKHPDIEVALSHCFSMVTRRDVDVSGPMLNSKLTNKLGHGERDGADAVSAEQR
jgi:hypothetical protein